MRTLQLRTVDAGRCAPREKKKKAPVHPDPGVFIKGLRDPVNFGSGFAALKEVLSALTVVQGAGKPVKAYLHAANTRDFYLALVWRTDIVPAPYGLIELPGPGDGAGLLSGRV